MRQGALAYIFSFFAPVFLEFTEKSKNIYKPAPKSIDFFSFFMYNFFMHNFFVIWRMNMKKIISVMLALLMIATLCACSGDGDEVGDDLDKYKQEDVVVTYVEIPETGERFYFETIDTETVAITGYNGKDMAHTLNIPKELDVSDPNDETTSDIRTVTTIAKEAFYYCSKINAINLPETVTTIEDYAFAGCALITEFEVPATVTTIGEGAFQACTALASLTFEEGSTLSSIGKYAFQECTALTDLELPASVKTIGDGAFWACEALATVIVNEGTETIGNAAFINCKALASVSLPASVTEIGTSAFAGSENLYIGSVLAPAGSYAATYIEEEMHLVERPITGDDLNQGDGE